MILCLDIGNTHLYGGVYLNGELELTFRKVSNVMTSSDELGIFLRTVLKENGVNPDDVSKVAFCSVVPNIVHSLKNCCRRYFNINPFVLAPGIKTGLNIKYANPLEVGADRIANAIAATALYPQKNLVIVDFGTATTFDAVTKNKDYLGGAIISGLKISMEALEKRTAKLPTVEIIKPLTPCGRTTIESIQSGLYYGNLGMVKEIVGQMSMKCFNGTKPIVIGTGGFAGLFKDEKVFDEIIPNLVLSGVYHSLKKNC